MVVFSATGTLGQGGEVYWAMAGGKMGEKEHHRNLMRSTTEVCAVQGLNLHPCTHQFSVFVQFCQHYARVCMLPQFSPRLSIFPIPPQFFLYPPFPNLPHSPPPLSPHPPLFSNLSLGNVVGKFIAGRVGNSWALHVWLSGNCVCSPPVGCDRWEQPLFTVHVPLFISPPLPVP